MAVVRENDVLTIRDAVQLAAIIEAAQHGSLLRYVDSEGAVHEGVGRSLGTSTGAFLGSGVDVRDGYLRLTMTSTGWAGMDQYMPVSTVLDMLHEATMAVVMP